MCEDLQTANSLRLIQYVLYRKVTCNANKQYRSHKLQIRKCTTTVDVQWVELPYLDEDWHRGDLARGLCDTLGVVVECSNVGQLSVLGYRKLQRNNQSRLGFNI